MIFAAPLFFFPSCFFFLVRVLSFSFSLSPPRREISSPLPGG